MKSNLLTLICMLLIILFSYTAIAKLIDIKLFTIEMHNQPLPRWFSSSLVFLLPSIELLIVTGLLFENTRFLALITCLVLMLFFTVYTTLILIHVFPHVPCSCGGVIKSLTWKEHLVFNLFFDGMIIWALILHETNRKYKRIHA